MRDLVESWASTAAEVQAPSTRGRRVNAVMSRHRTIAAKLETHKPDSVEICCT